MPTNIKPADEGRLEGLGQGAPELLAPRSPSGVLSSDELSVPPMGVADLKSRISLAPGRPRLGLQPGMGRGRRHEASVERPTLPASVEWGNSPSLAPAVLPPRTLGPESVSRPSVDADAQGP